MEIKEQLKDEKKEEKKTRDSAIIRTTMPASMKHSMSIINFIKGKSVGESLELLEKVKKMKIAVPMKGEIPHRKGNIMSGRYPQKAAKNFIVLLKSLLGNANLNEIEEPLIFEAYANIGVRPFGRFGRYRRKRTNLVIKAVEKKKLKEVIKI